MGTIDYILQCEKDNKDLTNDIEYWKRKSKRLSNEKNNLKQALNKIREYIQEKQKIQYKFALSQIECDDILQIVDKVLGGSDD